VTVNNVHLIGAGRCTITAAQSGNGNYLAATSLPKTFTITKATATVSLSGLMQMYTGSPLPVTITTNPSQLGVEVTYVGRNGTDYQASSTPPTQIGTYFVTVVVNDNNYRGSSTGPFIITTNMVNLNYMPILPFH